MRKATERANVLSNAQDKKLLKQIIIEMTHIMQRVDNERETLADIVKDAVSKFGLPAKRIKKLASTMYKQSYSEFLTENENFELLYESLFKNGEKAGPPNDDEEEEFDDEEVEETEEV